MQSQQKSGKLKSALLAIEFEFSHLYSNLRMTLRPIGRKKLWSKWLLKPDVHLQNEQEKNTTAKSTEQQSFLHVIGIHVIQLSIGEASLPNIKYKSSIEW